jgi:lactoylglutathione lyase
MRIAHTMIRVGDLQRSIDFYTKKLGFELVRTRDNEEGRFTLAFLQPPGGGSQLELTHNWDRDTYDLGDGYGHLALAVEHPGETYDALMAKGVPEYRPFNGRYAFVKDPDGYQIELVFARPR